MEHTPRFPSLFFRQRLNATVLPMLGGISLFLLLSEFWATLILLLCAAVGFAVVLLKRGETGSIFLCVLAGIALSLTVMGMRGIESRALEGICHTPRRAEGYVVTKENGYCDLSLCSLDGKPFYKRVRVIGETDWNLGEKRRVTLILHSPDPQNGRSDGADLLAEHRGADTVVGKSRLYTLVGEVRAYLKARFATMKNGGFLTAVLLGDRSGLTQSQTNAFRRTASSHILAISGLHISQTVAFLVAVLQLFPVPRKLTRVFLYPLVLVLYLLAGAGVSVFRASVMTLFSLTGLLLRIRSDSVTALCFSAALLVTANPFALESPSFLLSYVSTFGVVYCGVPLSAFMRLHFTEKGMNPVVRKLQFFVLLLAISSVSFVFTMPVQLILFGTVAPFAPLYAVLLIPPFQLCLILSLLGAVLTAASFLPDFVADLCLRIPAAFPDLVEFVAKGAPLPIEMGNMALPVAVCFVGMLLFAFWKKAPMTSVFLIQGIAIVFFGVFSLCVAVLG